MKNQKVSSIPQLIKDDLIVNDPLAKSNILNDIFNAKATVQGNLDPVPILPVNENIRSPLSNLNTSPIEVAKLCRDIKKVQFLILWYSWQILIPNCYSNFFSSIQITE